MFYIVLQSAVWCKTLMKKSVEEMSENISVAEKKSCSVIYRTSLFVIEEGSFIYRRRFGTYDQLPSAWETRLTNVKKQAISFWRSHITSYSAIRRLLQGIRRFSDDISMMNKRSGQYHS